MEVFFLEGGGGFSFDEIKIKKKNLARLFKIWILVKKVNIWHQKSYLALGEKKLEMLFIPDLST